MFAETDTDEVAVMPGVIMSVTDTAAEPAEPENVTVPM
jgi:hypothetical protein